MSLPETARASVVLACLLGVGCLAVVLGAQGVAAQTAAPAGTPAAQAEPAKPAKKKVEKSVRLDKHAGPWTVIYHWRPWTDIPETEEFVKATHPDPKSLEYAPLVGKDHERPKPRDPAGVAALQAELEGDLAHNAARGKAINDIGAAAPAEAVKKGKGSAARARKVAKASKASKPQ